MLAYSCTVTPVQSGDGHHKETNNDTDTKAHHVRNRRGETVKFRNPYPSYQDPGVWAILMLNFKHMLGIVPKPKPNLADNLIPVVKPEFLSTRTPSSASSGKLRATWLGHACYYVEYPSGLRVLFDPVFEDCCAPVTFLGFRRYSDPPCAIADLPFVDAVVISHSHYDHLSYPSVQEIQKHHPNAHFFVGLGLEKSFRKGGLDRVTEMDWWEETQITLTPQGRERGSETETGTDSGKASLAASDSNETSPKSITATITCLPSQHMSGRTALDQNTTLWASWGVRSGSTPDNAKTVWFGGDTAYRTVPKVAAGVDDYGPEYAHLPVCPQFRQIGHRLGSIDLGLIPIGAYAPRHIFSHMHADPFDSVEIFRDTGCRRAMAIHWGTWELTFEEPLEPPRRLKEALKRKGLPETGVFDTCKIGETREF